MFTICNVTAVVVGAFGSDLSCVCAELDKRHLVPNSVLRFSLPSKGALWLVLAQLRNAPFDLARCRMNTGVKLSSMADTEMVQMIILFILG